MTNSSVEQNWVGGRRRRDQKKKSWAVENQSQAKMELRMLESREPMSEPILAGSTQTRLRISPRQHWRLREYSLILLAKYNHLFSVEEVSEAL